MSSTRSLTGEIEWYANIKICLTPDSPFSRCYGTAGRPRLRQLADVFYPQGGDAYYATVQKLLDRLEGKGCVARDRRSSAHVFRSRIDRDELIGRRLEAVAERPAVAR